MLRDLNVLYQCDPMHGNTVVLSSGLKTRFVETIMVEIAEVISAHRSVGSRIHGIHLETTGADVTECVGCGVHVDDVPNRYESACDPRLNPTQAKAVVAYTLQLLNHDVKVPSSMASSSRLTTADTSASGSLSFSSDEERSI
jgi:3-deoxy-D-arabino-heptulosonate 7-phosphate (DAHP) synthase class II